MTRDGITVHYARYGSGTPAVMLLPTWSLVHARHWKFQIAYLARHFTVLTFDGRGAGRSDRPASPAAYHPAEFAADTLAVMDATGTERAVFVSVSCGALWCLHLCAEQPDRVGGAAFVSPAVPFAPPPPERRVQRFDEVIDDPVGFEKYNAHHWKSHYRDFVEFFAGRIFTEAHSTKQYEDAVGWALEIDPATLTASSLGVDEAATPLAVGRLAKRVRCPVLVIHGSDDAVRSHAQGAALAERTGGALVTLAGSGHFPHLRDPVQVNLLLRQFVEGTREGGTGG